MLGSYEGPGVVYIPIRFIRHKLQATARQSVPPSLSFPSVSSPSFPENPSSPNRSMRFMYANRSPNHTPVSSPVIPGIGDGPANSASSGLLPSGYRHTSSAEAGRGESTLVHAIVETDGPKRFFRAETISSREDCLLIQLPLGRFVHVGLPTAGRRHSPVVRGATAIGVERSIALGEVGSVLKTRFRRFRKLHSNKFQTLPTRCCTARSARCLPSTCISSVSPRMTGWTSMPPRNYT